MNPLLPPEIQEQIKEFLKSMKDPVTFVLFTKNEACETCQMTQMLLKEITGLSSKLTLIEKDLEIDQQTAKQYHVSLAPSFVLLDKDGVYKGIKFNGIPAGHEINSFLSAILDMSGREFELDKESIARIQKINKNVNIKVFVTLSCPHCPGAVSKAHRLALLNPHIEAEMIEAQTFMDLSQKYNVSGVPKIVINDTHELVGNQPIEAFLQEMERL
ncbi:MAG: glutaredoxin [Acholeplasmataceae bacterium]|nr:thioredoxin family protein [Candidatus Izemoplasmatales bacterium]NLF48452.1 glutaredoxin [Acholeplasmataceae bacterium]